MTNDIDAAINELELCQFELEQMELLMNDPTDCPISGSVLEKCFKIRMWMHRRNIEALTEYVIAEMEKQPLNLNIHAA